MAGRYVPPHMRNKASSTGNEAAGKFERKLEDGYTLEEIANQFGSKQKTGTLNSGIAEGALAFIVLFRDQHPQWPPQIFCKSNLHLLPAEKDANTIGDIYDSEAHPKAKGTSGNETYASNTNNGDAGEGTRSPSESIPVFTEEISAPIDRRRQGRRFVFEGYYDITNVEYLAPRSKELIKMLDTKFSKLQKERTPESWNISLSIKWAVVSLKKVEGQEARNPMMPLKEIPVRGVTQMLEQMRLGKEERVNEAGGSRRVERLDIKGGEEHG